MWALRLLASATVVGAALLADLVGGPAVSLTEVQKLIATIDGPVPLISISDQGAAGRRARLAWHGLPAAARDDEPSPGRSAAACRLAGMSPATVLHRRHRAVRAGTVQLERVAGHAQRAADGVADRVRLRAGEVVAAIAVHIGVNATVAVLTVKSPVTQAFVLAVQVVVVVVLHQAASRRR